MTFVIIMAIGKFGWSNKSISCTRNNAYFADKNINKILNGLRVTRKKFKKITFYNI